MKPRLVLVGVAAAALSVLVPATLSAQPTPQPGLVSSVPAPSSRVEDPPTLISLTFAGPVSEPGLSVRILGSDRTEVEAGRPSRRATNTSVVLVDDVPALVDGTWVVVWSATLEDGRAIEGSLPFQVGDAASSATDWQLEQILAGLGTDSDLGFVLGLGRWVLLLGTFVLVGSVVLTRRSALAASKRLALSQMAAVLLVTVGSAVVLFVHGAYVVGGSWGEVFDARTLSDSISGRVGAAALASAFLSLAWLGLVLTSALGSAATRWWRRSSLLLAVPTVAAAAVAGRGATSSVSVLGASLSVVHVACLTVWLGGVLTLWLGGVPLADGDGAQLADLHVRDSLVAAPLAVLSGILVAAEHARGWDTLASSDWGDVLLVKVAAVAVLLLVALLVRSRLEQRAPGARRVLLVESVVIVGVLATTALLSQSNTVTDEAARQSFGISLVADDVVADIAVAPAAVGTAEIHVFFSPPGGMLERVTSASMSLASPSISVPPMPVDLVESGPNHWSAVVILPYAATWEMNLDVTGAAGSAIPYSTEFVVGE